MGLQAGPGKFFESQGVLVTSDRLVVAGRTWPLAEVEAVESIHRPPRAFPWLVSLLVAMVLGLPPRPRAGERMRPPWW